MIQRDDVIGCLQSFYGEEWHRKWREITAILEGELHRKSIRQRRVKFGVTEKLNLNAHREAMFDSHRGSPSPTAPSAAVNGMAVNGQSGGFGQHQRVQSQSIDLNDIRSPNAKPLQRTITESSNEISEPPSRRHSQPAIPVPPALSLETDHTEMEMEEKRSEVEMGVIAGTGTPKKKRFGPRESSMSLIQEMSASDTLSSSSESPALQQRQSFKLKRRMSSFRNAKILKLQKSRSRRNSDVSSTSVRDNNGAPTAPRAHSQDSVLTLRRNGWSFGKLFGRKEKEKEMNEDDGDLNGNGNGRRMKERYSAVGNGEGLSDGTLSNDENDGDNYGDESDEAIPIPTVPMKACKSTGDIVVDTSGVAEVRTLRQSGSALLLLNDSNRVPRHDSLPSNLLNVEDQELHPL